MKLDRLPVWIGVSWFLYTIIRIVEYSTGQAGSPEWLVDFIPIVLPFVFVLFDNIFIRGGD